MTTRRTFLRLLGAGASAGLALPRVGLAVAPTDRRLVVLVLRGGLDGLAAVPPLFDPDYRTLRGALAIAEPGKEGGGLDLDGRFALHPALRPLYDLYRAGELAVFHAVASPYRARSHFDGQDILENGTPRPRGARDGWLNRAIALLRDGQQRVGLAIGNSVPLILRGPAPVASWAPQALPTLDGDFLDRLAILYRDDAVFAAPFGEALRARGLDEIAIARNRRMGNDAMGEAAAHLAARAIGELLAKSGGSRIAVIEIGGWDTHSNQGAATGRLARQFEILAGAVTTLRELLGPAWRQTVALAITEFGRTAATNGTGGTDHGTASVALLAGGAVAGGRIVADWPGLNAERLFEGRDLAPTRDLRALFKGLLAEHLDLPSDAIERIVLPESGNIRPERGLIRA